MVHHEVFFDPSGRRWRRVKLWALLVPALLGALVGISWGPVHAPPQLAGREPPEPVANVDGIEGSPMIGNGPLARLVVIRGRGTGAVAVDPLTGRTVGALTAGERRDAGASHFAIYRYGYDHGVHRTISLTFDDGPSPAWTPQILDLLSKHKVPATFFVIGADVVRYPSLVRRQVHEGHAVANHTMTHPELTRATIERELVTTDRVLTATTDVRTGLARLPYDGYGPSGRDTEGELLLEAERLGYQVSIEDVDSNDWRYTGSAGHPAAAIPLPSGRMDNMTILLHDGGGDRTATLAYLRRLIPWAKAHGYTFHTLPQVSQAVATRTRPQAANLWDRETLWTFQAAWILPNILLRLLFWTAMISMVVGGLANIALATLSEVGDRRRRARTPAVGRTPAVTAVVAAFNEDAVIARCLAAASASRYPGLVEIIVIDDGSTDATADIVEAAAVRDPRIQLIRQPNLGKPHALNRAFAEAVGEIVVTLDADTLLTCDTVGHLVRRFTDDPDGRMGAVAGTVKVGNAGNVLTRWQALEYLIQVGVDRGAQNALHAIVVVPGACAAWRRDAVVAVGGFSTHTLAEDCDLALSLQARGYRVVQCARAESYTEAPKTFRDLRRQRFRWTFGNAQALWKHRSMMLNHRYGWLGMYSLPFAALSLLLPVIFLPFVYLMTVLTIHRQGVHPLLAYGAVFLAMQFVQAVAGIALCREGPRHLLVVPVYRLIAEPLRAYLLGRSTLAVLRGTRSRWNKVARTGTVRLREVAPVEARR
jgi:cellulose synthase/poly-beta-1,6-N-acetylglucosamine synthase-like glycosyltransferase/peptidoglycan/xylan/chitin deacetylase (PgdA/CDA1 family)